MDTSCLENSLGFKTGHFLIGFPIMLHKQAIYHLSGENESRYTTIQKLFMIIDCMKHALCCSNSHKKNILRNKRLIWRRSMDCELWLLI